MIFLLLHRTDTIIVILVTFSLLLMNKIPNLCLVKTTATPQVSWWKSSPHESSCLDWTQTHVVRG